MKTADIEIAIARMFNTRKTTIVPRINSGMGIHECDMMILTGSGYASEVEIKISVADLRKDLKKPHGHESDKIKYLYFAMPEEMEKHIDLVPERAGIIIVRTINERVYARLIRFPIVNKNAKPFMQYEINQYMYLAYLRYWNYRFNNNPNITEDENIQWNPDNPGNEI